MNNKHISITDKLEDNALKHYLAILVEMPGNIQLYAIDKNFKYILFNNAYKKYLIETFDITINIGDSVLDVFKDYEDINKEKKLLEKSLSGAEFSQIGNYSLDNKIFYYKDIYKPVKNFKNEVIGVVVYYTDITPRKKNERILNVLLNISESGSSYDNLSDYLEFIRNQLGKIIDTTNFFVALYDKATKKYTFPYFIDEYDNIDTFSSYDLSQSATDFVRRKGKPFFMNSKITKKLVKKGGFKIIGTPSPFWIGIPLKTESGTIGVMVTQNYHVKTDMPTKNFEIMEFVSDHVARAVELNKAQYSMKKVTRELQYAQSIAKLGRCEIDKNTNEVILSNEAKRIFGFSLKQEHFDIKDIGEIIIDNSKEVLLKLLKPEKEGINEFAFKIFNKKIQKIVYINIMSKIEYFTKDVNGKIRAMIQDITKQEEDKRELELAKEKAEQSDKLKSAFLANMSHEIRTPMNAILGFSKLLTQEHLPKETREKYADYINRGGQNLMQLINDIIDVAKIEAGQLTIQKEYCDINIILDEILESFNQQKVIMQKEHISLILNKETENELILFTDPVRFRQIIINLVGNALKFTNEGSINFGYKTHKNKDINFYVKDTGPGIPEDKENIIFSRFGQIIDSEIVHPGGTGLGLSITQNLVNLLGGRINLLRNEEEGAHFTFNLPFDTTKYKTRKTNKKENINYTLKKDVTYNILLVEDNGVNRTLVKDIISANTNNIILDYAETGLIAKQKAIKNKYDLIFMDIKLPDIDGYEVTKYIRENEEGDTQTPIIALSAHAMKEFKEKAYKSGMNHFLSKPFIFDDFLQVIKKYTNKQVSKTTKKNIKMTNKEYSVIDLSILTSLYANNPERLKTIIGLYKTTIDDLLAKTNNFIQNSESEKLKVSAHSLKSSLGYLGIEKLAIKAKEIEHNNTDLDFATKAIKEINTKWEQAIIELNDFLSN